MIGRCCGSPARAAGFVVLGLAAPVALGSAASIVRAAVLSDPVPVVRRLVGDLDLQTSMPGNVGEPKSSPTVSPRGRREAASDLNLHIPGATTILWAAIAAAVALALFALKDYVPGFSRRDRTRAEAAAKAQTTEAAERMVQAGDEADDLAGLGRIAEAMHLLLLRSLVELRRRLGVSFADSLTSREILARLALPEEARQALGDLIRRVEFAHFGAKPARPEDYAACRASYERLIAAMLDASRDTRPTAAAA